MKIESRVGKERPREQDDGMNYRERELREHRMVEFITPLLRNRGGTLAITYAGYPLGHTAGGGPPLIAGEVDRRVGPAAT